MKCLRITLIAWIAAWLAMANAYATVMPFCKHALGGSNPDHAAAGAHHGDPHKQHHQDHAYHGSLQESSAPASTGFNCDGCGLCHLACSPMAVAASNVSLPVLSETYQHGVVLHIPALLPDRPRHPPRT